jgi:hypothetical protein
MARLHSRSRRLVSVHLSKVQKDGRGSTADHLDEFAKAQTFHKSACDFRFPHSTRAARHVEQSTKHHASHSHPATIHKTALWAIQSFRAILSDRSRDSYDLPDTLNVAHLVCDKECYETLEL